MRTMYDAVTARNIPPNAEIVGGYDDGRYVWSAADWARFPNAVHVHISSVGTNVGHVLDCEPGNPNAVQAVDWILMRRAADVDPYVYTAEWAPGYTWADVVAACNARGVALPHWWKAPGASSDLGTHDGTEPLMVQTQYPGPFDVGVAADFLPGIEGNAPPEPPPIEEDIMVKFTYGNPEAQFVSNGFVYEWIPNAQGVTNYTSIFNAVDLGPINGLVGMGVPSDPTTAKMSGQPWPVAQPAQP